MKRLTPNLRVLNLTLNLLTALWLPGVAVAQPTNAIQRLPLNPMAVTRIPVALDRLTTIRFPSPVSDLQAALVTAEPHPDALFLVAFQPGNAFFSVRALAPNTNTTLNVVWKSQTYVLELAESPAPWLSVIFDAPSEPATNAPPKVVTPARLLGLLDTAKAYGLLRQQHPSSVAGVEVVRPNSRRDYGDYTIRVEEVFRFDAEDTLVFRIGVSNKTQTLIRYVPDSLMVRAGQRVYFQSIAEATGILPAAAEVPVYFAITGNADGSRGALSPHNEFMVFFCREDEPAPTTLPLASSPAPQSPPQPVNPGVAAAPLPVAPAPAPVVIKFVDCCTVLLQTNRAPSPPAPIPPAPAPSAPASGVVPARPSP